MKDPVLILRGHSGSKRLVYELSNGVHDIGRAGRCSVQIDEPSVSRRHARLHIGDGRSILEDLGSSNGTSLNGHRLEGTVALKHGDVVSFGSIVLSVDTGLSGTEMLQTQDRIRADVSISLDEARNYETGEGGKKAFLFGLLAEAGELMTGRREPEAIFEPLLELVGRALQPERIFLLLQEDPPPAMPRIAASRHASDGRNVHGTGDGILLSRTLLDQVLRDRAAFLTEDASQDERLFGGESIISLGTRSAMAAPLFDNEQVIGVLYADSRDPVVRYDRDELKAFVLLANVVAVAITQARYHEIEKERRRLAAELEAAQRIMDRLLPVELPEVPGLKLCAHIEPCEEVAGDLYDARLMPDGRLLLIVGDVSGKGLPAALLVAALLPVLRLGSEDCRDAGCLIERVNEQLYASTEAHRFATLFLGLLDPGNGRMEYVNAGHNPPLLVGPDGGLTALTAVGLPVGMMPGIMYETRTQILKPGERLVFYSDGVTEAINDTQDMYGDERLCNLLSCSTGCSLDVLRNHILDDVAVFTAGSPLNDDLTLLLVERGQVEPM